MATPIPWPYDQLRPAKITRHIAARTIAGTVSASGFTQRVAVPAATWNIQYDGIVIVTADQLRWWDYIAGVVDGGANPILVYLVGEDNGGADNGLVLTSEAAGSSTVSVSRPVPVLAGHHFTIFNYLYRAIGVSEISGGYAVMIRPTLRTSVAAGYSATFNKPYCKCRLKTDDEMILDIDSARMGMGKVQFVEDPVP